MRAWWALGFTVSGAACGGSDAKPDAPIDVPAARCDPNGAFGAPVLVGGINSDEDDATARLSEDELEVTFGRITDGVWDLWRASRRAVEEPFDPPALITSVNSVSSDVWPTLTPDGLTLLFDADRTTPGTYHIWRSTRTAKTAPFGPPQPRGDLRDNDFHPMLANEHALYFSSAMRGGLGLREILRAPVADHGMIGTPELLVGGVNTDALEDTPAVTSDERQIFFRRQGADADVYTASRSTAADAFGAATAVPVVAQPGINELPTWVSPDGCHLYLYSDAPTTFAGSNVWMASRVTTSP